MPNIQHVSLERIAAERKVQVQINFLGKAASVQAVKKLLKWNNAVSPTLKGFKTLIAFACT